MSKISKTIRISPERWEEISNLAKLKETTPSQWILDSVVGRLEGTLCCVEAHSVSRNNRAVKQIRKPQVRNDEPVASVNDIYGVDDAWRGAGYDLERIRKLQEEIADARSTYEAYLSGLTEEEIEIEKKSWYVVEAKDRWDTLQAELDEIVPKPEDKKDV